MWSLTLAGMGEIALRTTVVYGLLLLLIRLAGKREIGQLTPFDLVVLLLVSNAVQNAMTGPDTTVTGGAVAAVTLIAVNFIVAIGRQRFRGFRRFVEGIPIMLVSHGDIQYRALKREHMTVGDLMAALREHEVADVSKCELAMLEIDGTVSVLRQEGSDPTQLRHSRKPLKHHHRAPND
jgi:uncharacterized membrane protein YcaP (DUF421 family)